MMDASAWAAWYAAGLSTVTAAWEAYKHFTRGPLLKIEAWYHRDPHSDHPLLHVSIRNKGDESARIESIDVVQDGRKFDRDDHITIEPDGSSARQKESVAPSDRVVYQLQPFNREKVDPPTPVRLLDGRKPALVYVRAAAFKKELVAKVRPLPRET